MLESHPWVGGSRQRPARNGLPIGFNSSERAAATNFYAASQLSSRPRGIERIAGRIVIEDSCHRQLGNDLVRRAYLRASMGVAMLGNLGCVTLRRVAG
jgi:hypothetical protein